MPSFASQLFASFVRLYFKRRPLPDEGAMVQLARAKFNPPQFLKPPLPAAVRVTPVNESLAEHAPVVRGEWVEWPDRPAPTTIYYLHGGGYIGCSPATHRPFAVSLSQAIPARIFMLDYRLAPEHRFPAPVEDAVAGYRWLLAQGIAPDKLVIGGDSAGGGLTIAALVALRDAGLPLPRAAFVLSPWTDLACTGASLSSNEATDAMFYAAGIRRAAEIYLGGAAATEPLASPLYADLRGLPPLRIYASTSEVLRDDAIRLAARAQEQQVAVELRLQPDLIHVWPLFARYVPEARTTLAELVEFIHGAVGEREQPS